MKKILLLTVLLAFCHHIQAQSWLPENNHKTNLKEIIESYERKGKMLTEKEGEDEEEILSGGKIRKEGKNYHFDRWVWYWKHHLDEKGNLASPARTLDAWQNYLRTQTRKNFKITNQSQWNFVGPSTSPGGYNGIGRINAVGFHPSDSNTFIVATAGGGAWRTTNGGVNWLCLTDNLPVLGTSDVDYNPLNPNTIYLCTGDRDASDTYSLGLLKSTNGGLTWDTTGLQFNRGDLKLTNSLVINPLDTNSLTLATSDGMMKSFDGGQTWAKTQSGNFKEVHYCPTDTSVLFAAAYANDVIYRSANGGLTWQVILSVPTISRVSIAVTPAAPNVVKAVVASSPNYGLLGVYSSTDTGKTFTNIFGSSNDCNTNILSGSSILSSTSCGGQGWYDLTIAISPLNANTVYIGGVNTYWSNDGGYNWTIVNQWTSSMPGIKVVHADKHMLTYNPLNPLVLYECNDGGIYKSYNPSIWTDISDGLQITQFYRLATTEMSNFVIAGAQDNGTKRVTFTGSSNELTGGDGMDCQIDYTDPDIFYTSSQYGNFRRTYNNGNNFTNISNNIPGQPDGAWITPLAIHPFDPYTLVVGYEHVFASPDRGDNWVDISPNFSLPVNIERISLTPQHQNFITILQGSTIRYTKNFGANWYSPPLGFGGSISDIMIDPKDTNRIFVTYSGYTNTKVAQYHFTNGWSKFQDSLPNVPIQCITMDTSNGTLYVGTDVGVFYRDPGMTSWEAYNTGLPVIEVTDLSINYTTQEIWASTYGRGVWKSPRHTALTGISTIPLSPDVISISPNPNKGRFTIFTNNEALKKQSVSIRIINFSGNTDMIKEASFDSSGKLNIETDLTPGTYIVEINAKGSMAARTKMIVL